MASEVDISNIALSYIGSPNSVTAISPPENTVEAEACALWYPIARDQALEHHAWKFATRRASLTPVTLPSYIYTWAYAYQVPNLCLREVAVFPPSTVTPTTELVWTRQVSAVEGTQPDTNDPPAQDFQIELDDTNAKILYTNVQSAILRYIVQNTNTAMYSPAFVRAVGRLLASYLAGHLQKDDNKAATQLKIYETVDLPRAVALDGMAQRNSAYRTDFRPAHIRVR